MEVLAEWGYIGLFISSFLAATIIPLSSEIVLSILLANNYDLFSTLMVNICFLFSNNLVDEYKTVGILK